MGRAYHDRPYLGAEAAGWDVLGKGYLAVDFFFMLSGFILAHVYRERFRTGTYSHSGFVLKRIARIYPMHIVTGGRSGDRACAGVRQRARLGDADSVFCPSGRWRRARAPASSAFWKTGGVQLGDVASALYMVHVIVAMAIFEVAGRLVGRAAHVAAASVIIAVVAVIIAIVATAISDRVIERPGRR